MPPAVSMPVTNKVNSITLLNKSKILKIFCNKNTRKRDALQQDLNKIDTAYGEASQNRRHTEQQILRQKQQIAFLERSSLLNRNQTQMQQQALAEQIRLAYLLQRQGPVKLLLNQQNLRETGRLLHYYQSLTLYRLNTIKNCRRIWKKLIFTRNSCTLNI